MAGFHKRGEELTYPEFVAFVKWVNRFPTKTLCAETIGVSRPTLEFLLNNGRSRKHVIEKIREEIQELV